MVGFITGEAGASQKQGSTRLAAGVSRYKRKYG